MNDNGQSKLTYDDAAFSDRSGRDPPGRVVPRLSTLVKHRRTRVKTSVPCLLLCSLGFVPNIIGDN